MTLHDLAESKRAGVQMPAAGSPAGTGGGRRWVKVVVVAVLVVPVAFLAFLLGRVTAEDGDVRADRAAEAVALVDEGLEQHVSGDAAGAAAKYRQAVVADDTNVLAHYNLGLIHQLEGRTKEATIEYERTIALDPTYAPALHNLGVLAATADDRDSAIDWYRRAVEADAGFAESQFNLGLLLLETGDVDGGNAALQTAIELDPSLESRLQVSEG